MPVNQFNQLMSGMWGARPVTWTARSSRLARAGPPMGGDAPAMEAAERVSVAKDGPAHIPEVRASRSRPATYEPDLDSSVDRIFGGSPPRPPESVAASLAVPRLRTPVLLRAQRQYGNRTSQQIVAQSRALQRKCDGGGECSKYRDDGQPHALQRHASTAGVPEFHGIPSSQGEPLGDETRKSLEGHFATGLSSVRVHTGSPAAESARSLDALAYTTGRDIYFAPGMYAPHSTDGQRLLAHEVAHVVQQGAGKEPTLAAKSAHGVKIGAPDDGLETEADRAAQEFVERGQPPEEEEQRKRQLEGSTRSVVQRQPNTGSGSVQGPVDAGATTTDPSAGPKDAGLPGGVATPPPPPPPDAASRVSAAAVNAAQTEVVELKGTPTFQPSAALSEMIDFLSPASLSVRVRFGSLADGQVYVQRQPGATGSPPGPGLYETTDLMANIKLHHPAFPGGPTAPTLFVQIRDNVVTGRIGFIYQGVGIPWFENILSWRGLSRVQPIGIVNALKDGVLRYELTDFAFTLEDSFEGTGNFSVVDGTEKFSAEARVRAEGVADTTIPLHHTPGASVFGSQPISLTLSPKDAFGGTISGSLTATLANGVMDVVGTGRYTSGRLNGAFSVVMAPRWRAWMYVIQQLPAGGARNISAGAATAKGLVIAGWGTLSFHINDWLTGNASVVVDPDGYITSHGIIRPARSFEFLTDKEKYSAQKKIAEIPEQNVTFVPVWIAEVGGHAAAELWAHGRVGPATIYGLEVEGQFSTRPGTVFEGRVTGRANLSANASLEARINAGLHFSFIRGGHLKAAQINVRVVGKATVRAYVELQPTFAREASSKPDQAQYRITAALTAAGAATLGLSGSVDFSVLGIGPTINVGQFEYPVGSIGVSGTISHVLGSHAPIDVDLAAADFEPGRFKGFLSEVLNKKAPKDEGNHKDVDLAQSGKPAEQPTTPTILRTTFNMNGAPHTLWVEYSPQPVLKMASPGDGKLVDKLGSEIAAVEGQKQQQQGEEAELLAQEVSKARGLLQRTVTVEQSLTSLESESRQNPDAAGFQELPGGLSEYGAQYQKTDLGGTAPPASPQASPVQTPLAAGSWIILKTGSYEQVITSGSVRKRGSSTPETFQAITPEGRVNSHSYKDEGAEWDRTIFVHGSKHAVPVGGGRFELKPSEQGSEFIRPTFYGDTRSSRETIKNAKLPALLNPANKKEFFSEGNPSLELAQGYKIDASTGKALVPVENASPDHEPSIAEHWTLEGGNDTSQASRQGWNKSLATYQIISLALNLSLGGKDVDKYTHLVGMNFRGPGE